MIKQFSDIMSSEDIVASPVDEMVDGVIIKIEEGLLREFIDESVHDKFNNLDDKFLKIYFESKYKDKTIPGNDRIRYYAQPQANSNLGKFLKKYGKIDVGVNIKVLYNSEGFGSIVLGD